MPTEYKQCYSVDGEGYFTGDTNIFFGDDGVPDGYVDVAPPPPRKNIVYRWTGETWEEVSDLRGTRYWMLGDQPNAPRIWDRYGPLPDGILLEEPPPSESDYDAKLQYLSSYRYSREIAGTTWNGKPVLTDRESRSNYHSEYIAIAIGDRSDDTPWKLATGFESISNADIIEIAKAARRHVLACFGAEKQVTPLLDDLNSFEEIRLAFEEAFKQIKAAVDG